ncbi:MAG: metalloprotease, partial [Parachlamydiaceae bacterium]
EALKVRSLFDALREELAKNPRYFSDLIDKYLIDNPHSVHLIMKPDYRLEQEEREEEAHRLSEIQKSLSEKQKKAILQEAKKLDELQKNDVSEDILPTLTLNDIPKKVKSFPLEIREFENIKIWQHECFTNGLIYADLAYELKSIKDEEIPLFRLLMVLLTQLGVNGYSYEDTLNYMQAHTGGIFASLHINPQANNLEKMLPAIHIKGKALNAKADKLLTLMKGYASSLDFKNRERIKEVFFKHKTNLEASFNQSAFRYATNLSASALTQATRMSQLCFGLDYYNFIKSLNEPPFELLEDLYKRIFSFRPPDLVLGGERSILLDLEKNSYFGLNEITTLHRAHSDWDLYVGKPENRSHEISSAVAFIAHSFKTIPYTHPDSPYLAIASYLFDNLTLHPRIREQGGAYGGGA